MKIKRFISYILVIAALVILVSCGSTSNNDKASIDESSNTDITDPGSNNQGDYDQSQSKTEDNYYTITFKNDDGTVLKKADYKKGAMPSYDGTPSKDNTAEYTYTFNGWNPSIEAVSNDMVYTATYLSTKNSYTVTWKNWDGTVLEIDYNVEYGMTPIYNGSTPTRQSNQNNNYVFNGWDKIITSVTKDIEYTATFEAVPVSLCVVNFDSKGGTSISSQSVIKGEKVKKPINPTREGYTFDDWYYQGKKWSFDGYTVTEDVILEAGWSINSYSLELSKNNDKAGTISTNVSYNNDDFLDNDELAGFSNIQNIYQTNDYFKFGTNAFQKVFISGVGVSGVNYLGENKTYTYANVTSAGSYDESRYIKIIVPSVSKLYVAFVTGSKSESRGIYIDTTINTKFSNKIAGVYASNEDMAYIDVELASGEYYLNYTGSVRIYEMYLIGNTDEKESLSYSETYKYGEEITITATTNPGYTFNGWYDGENQVYDKETYTFNMPANNLSYTAKWTANTNVTYKVEHYQQNIDDDNYPTIPFEIDNLIGTTDTLTNAEVKIYEGFISPSITQVNINGDGSTVIKLQYTRNSYTVSLSNNNDKSGTITGRGTYKYGKAITITATTNPGYTFNGWYDGENQVYDKETYTFNMPFNDLSYEAKWTANKNTTYKVEHYKQNVDDNKYALFETDNLTGATDSLTNGEVKSYEGFTSPKITQVNISGIGNTVIKLYYSRNSYTVDLKKNIDNASTITGAGTYRYGKEITITAVTNAGYTFEGWYLNDSLYKSETSFTYTVGASSVEFEARYTVNKYKITIDNRVGGVTISGIISGNKYDYDTEIKLTTKNIPDEYTIRWSRSDGAKYFGTYYKFKVPSRDITIVATITSSKPYTRDGNKIYFGTYPQTKVDATNENGLVAYNTFDASTWISYKYHISSTQQDFMYYKDIDIDNDGTYDYRGVYFTQYRPYSCELSSSEANSWQDDFGYNTNTIYWFSYDPIEWIILEETSWTQLEQKRYKALIIANLILDSQDYYLDWDMKAFSHNGGTGYGNNYQLSNIRKFLINNFYDTAFEYLQKDIIRTTSVDNSYSSTAQTGNQYYCSNTSDRIFLLSAKEVTTYKNELQNLKFNYSDYAVSQGYRVNFGWWLRSPDNAASCARYCSYIDVSFQQITYTSMGVRPACWITL